MTAEEILSFSACASCKIYCVFGTCVIAGKTSRAVAAPLRLSVAYCYVSCGTGFGACAAGIATFACTETFIVSYEAAEELSENRNSSFHFSVSQSVAADASAMAVKSEAASVHKTRNG